MLLSDLASLITSAIDWVTLQSATWGTSLAVAKTWILDHFGTNGMIASLVVLGVLMVFIVTQLVRLTMAALKYLVVPSVVLAYIATLILPVTFSTALPVTVTACSFVLLFKG